MNTIAARAWSAVRAPATRRGKSWFADGRTTYPSSPITLVAVAHSARKSYTLPSPDASKKHGLVRYEWSWTAPLWNSDRYAWLVPKCRKKSAWNPDGTDTCGCAHSLNSAASGCVWSSQSRSSRHSAAVSFLPGSSLTSDDAMSTRNPATPVRSQ
jgi:hypothetical protein